MPEHSSDAHAPHAPYMRVLDALTADIKAGKIGPGDRIPSESELCARHKVARETARRAVRILRERGTVETQWGKGTFVVGPAEPASEGD
ncbi:winged helix-turn-helix domain-containing protein [Streptomyces subrutilus]|uniref:winged helix-turn-helix domain-containing protein n=1 Tax=Streptomyces subrutilus TaxID=36818 RepID=UPI0033CA4449